MSAHQLPFFAFHTFLNPLVLLIGASRLNKFCKRFCALGPCRDLAQMPCLSTSAPRKKSLYPARTRPPPDGSLGLLQHVHHPHGRERRRSLVLRRLHAARSKESPNSLRRRHHALHCAEWRLDRFLRICQHLIDAVCDSFSSPMARLSRSTLMPRTFPRFFRLVLSRHRAN